MPQRAAVPLTRLIGAALVMGGGACVATGCGEVCLRSGTPVDLKLLAVELDRSSADPVLSVAASAEEAAELLERLGMETTVPTVPSGRQMLVFQTRVSRHGSMEWIESAEEEAASGDLVLKVRSDFPCEELLGDTGGGGEYLATVWMVASSAEPSLCRHGRRCGEAADRND